ncbi:MAG: Ribosomal subunit interface protein [Candidatus Moranbacteria bacterium GW2011_GWF2_34_56]|nr:MAG: Ribosomal subunit interface protein [Candidatus Moranbacteria bacterium GW2011_GWF1_34_10]KKP64061.1 MAG: Ribosomal subunit interface protein [Candidatus Moranbacteria bacterium GW2011_GWF2_34_56]HBI17003.1 ribosome-associated translation inhibitor RaiA [Candidatus Moranbacteria bacterium]
MNIKYLYKNISINDTQRDYIEKRLSSLKKIVENILETNVEIEKDKKGKYRIEVMIKTPRDLFRAEDITESVEGSIDIVVEELRTQISRKKDKIWTKIIRGARSVKKRICIDRDARF